MLPYIMYRWFYHKLSFMVIFNLSLLFAQGILWGKSAYMGFWEKINHILEYKISVDFNARVSRKKALWIIGAVTAALLITGFIIGETMFWGGDSRGVFDRGIEVLEKTDLSKSNDDSKTDLALAHYLNGDTPKAQGLFREILGKDGNNAAANIYYGLILADQKKYREAIPFIEKGIKQAPRREKLAYLYLGMSYYRLGDSDRALRYLDISVKADPGSPVGQYYLGLTYKKKGDSNKARAALEKALTLSGGNYPEAAGELKNLNRK